MLTSNRGFGDWNQVFADPVVASAIVDRLLHSATVLNIRGASYRVRNNVASRSSREAVLWLADPRDLCTFRAQLCALFVPTYSTSRRQGRPGNGARSLARRLATHWLIFKSAQARRRYASGYQAMAPTCTCSFK